MSQSFLRLLASSPGEFKVAQSESTTGTAILISTPAKVFGWIIEPSGTRTMNLYDGDLATSKWHVGRSSFGELFKNCSPGFIRFETSVGIDNGGIAHDVTYTIFYQDL